jgi:hypothetical protein
LRQVVEVDGKVAALLVWGPACYALKDRDQWISWSTIQRLERLKLIVQNRRFLVVADKGQSPNLASQAMGAALRALPGQWLERFGYRPLLAESFTDPEAYAGTCYRASNWEAVGQSAGHSRHRADFYVPNDRPKKLWLRPLCPQGREQLSAQPVPEDCRAGLIAAPTGTLPLKAEEVDSLMQVFRKAPDPRASNTVYRTYGVLTVIAMALLAGRREIAEIARFATTLSQPQRRRLGFPRKKGTKAFWQVPSYSVFYQVLTRMDPEAFAEVLSGWLQSRAGSLPGALALDGKMIRDHIGLLTLAQHEDGAPVAVAVYDQKEGTERCELSAASPPFYPNPNRARPCRNTSRPRLPHRASGSRFPARPNANRGAQPAHDKEDRSRERRVTLLPLERRTWTIFAVRMAPAYLRTLGRGGDPQPLASGRADGRGWVPFPQSKPASEFSHYPERLTVRVV